ncbi:LOW QUALITY PROTEIN: Hypothetical protein PHPALM_6558 [Phytophthora palmivora]|uniref:Uncharacterized protein n=1 Tax=Phytophthora palmivora TaxID=4796 RepID=A0A2P4YEK1_9STRA|nr:LOW QUALITY PROTEIN: Hypothetical protein PHPALM_6558 [Phytophthora palmivora]
MVCLWAGKRRWPQTRSYYKAKIGATSRRKGLASAERRARKWEKLSEAAATGLGDLEWRRLRLLVLTLEENKSCSGSSIMLSRFTISDAKVLAAHI